MHTVSFYIGDSESQRRRKRSKWAIPLIVGLVAAYAVARTKEVPVLVPPPAPVVTETIAPIDTVDIIPTETTATKVEVPVDPIPVPPPPPARPVFSPSRIDFGEGGRAPAQFATVRNEGGEPISLVSTTISGASFLATNGCANGVAPGAQCMVAVVFAPQKPGTSTGALTIVADGKRTRIPLRGSLPEPRVVVPPPPPPPPPTATQAPVTPLPPPPARQLCFDPPALHFKSVGKQSITLTNPERTPLRVVGVAVTTHGVIASGYEVDSAKCMRILGPGQRCRFTVRATELAIQRGETIQLQVFYDDLLTGQRRAATRSADCAQR